MPAAPAPIMATFFLRISDIASWNQCILGVMIFSDTAESARYLKEIMPLT